MSNEDLKKLALETEALLGEYISYEVLSPFNEPSLDSDSYKVIQNALQKVRDETIEECAKIVEISTIPSGNVFPLLLKKGALIRALKEKKE